VLNMFALLDARHASRAPTAALLPEEMEIT